MPSDRAATGGQDAALLDAQGVGKRFGAVVALSDGRLRVEAGEIHALLGANGCGKSTLCKVIAGTVAPDAGTIAVGGEAVQFRNPRDAEQAGIALFYQELSLIPQLSVAANIGLGREPRTGLGFVDRRRLNSEAEALIALFAGVAGAELKPEAIVADLTPDLRQIVEILKVLARRPRLIILDEATAALDGRQSARLFEILRARKAEGVSTLMISHRLDEVFAVSDRITVMRGGATVAELVTARTNRDQVVRHMVGDARIHPVTSQRMPPAVAEPRLTAQGVRNARVHDVSLSLRPGEIVGLGGLQGQGQSALLQGLFGALPFTAGRVTIAGEPVALTRTADAIRRGLAYVSGDRGRDAALTGRSIFENLVAALLVREKRRLVRPSELDPLATRHADSLNTQYAGLDAAIGTLSGGNQQKIFIARWLATGPRVLLLDDPTKGIDLAAKGDLLAIMRKLADEGASILIYSSEDAELIEWCDRVLVFNSGRIVTELAGPTLDHFHLARAAYGEAA
ncbi:sugar ABC transporter ATP-binding protein [Chelatococcus asaccharovorans]|uniref:sugar ABC transporter ATP-binding protein n=1 Tax=Chelatococcus asaccharovorans TaxID=28210 RepID=UPI00224C7245|nr:sugar ABC transporter ATP-binding protein [Chelatococcus asaccharovorans]CAH1662840.1 Ribose import ATP-binding protein RbsA 1 [Chelatococcus asaccharovorans]CAH1683043.1 Ribose import ATP-binding protein RbsA 1 [Chelatococcus asaccharovorans]